MLADENAKWIPLTYWSWWHWDGSRVTLLTASIGALEVLAFNKGDAVEPGDLAERGGVDLRRHLRALELRARLDEAVQNAG